MKKWGHLNVLLSRHEDEDVALHAAQVDCHRLLHRRLTTHPHIVIRQKSLIVETESFLGPTIGYVIQVNQDSI